MFVAVGEDDAITRGNLIHRAPVPEPVHEVGAAERPDGRMVAVILEADEVGHRVAHRAGLAGRGFAVKVYLNLG